MENLGSYETLFAVSAVLPEEEIKAVVNKFTTLIADNGTIENVNEWGKRRFAYPVNDITDGYYVCVNFKSEPSFPAELERIFGITDGILRSIVIRTEETKPAAPASAASEEAAE